MSGSESFPFIATQYTAASPTPLNIADVESRFNLDGPPSTPTTDNAVIYTLPGLPFDLLRTPANRLLVANLSSGGSAFIGVPDYNKQPIPQLGDFRGVFLRKVGDFARVLWTGTLWTLVATSHNLQVATVEQDPI